MTLNFRTVALVALFISKTAFGYEVDQFTRRNEPIRDSTALIDAEINKRIQYALESTNPNTFEKLLGIQGCGGLAKDHSESRRRLFTNLRDYLATQNPIGLVEAWSEKNAAVAKRRIRADESIYKTAIEKSIIMKVFGITSVITANNQKIGTDKLGHFLSEGYQFYRKAHTHATETEKIDSVQKQNFFSEQGENGLATTNIKSYADMAANYDGTRFWNKLCGSVTKNSTPDQKNYFARNKCLPNSYLKCENGSWILDPEVKFTLKNYVTPAWDETINCSVYHKDIDTLVRSEISKVVYTYKGDPKRPCPAEPNACKGLRDSYPGKVFNNVVHPLCKEAAGPKFELVETVSEPTQTKAKKQKITK